MAWWLSVQAGFGQYVDAVWKHRIDGAQFARFSAGDLEHTLGVAHRKHRLKLLHLIAELADRKLPVEQSAAQQLQSAEACGVKSRAMLASVAIGLWRRFRPPVRPGATRTGKNGSTSDLTSLLEAGTGWGPASN